VCVLVNIRQLSRLAGTLRIRLNHQIWLVDSVKDDRETVYTFEDESKIPKVMILRHRPTSLTRISEIDKEYPVSAS
jgi:hypothetical protein